MLITSITKYMIFFSVVTLISCATSTIYIGKINQYKDVAGENIKEGAWIEKLDSNSVLFIRYKNGLKEGRGKIVFNDGGYCNLSYKNDKKNGTANFYSAKGLMFRSEVYASGIKVRESFGSPKW